MLQTSRAIRRISIPAAFATMVAALAFTAAGTGPARASVPNSVQQVYRAGLGGATSTPVGDYTGDPLTLQAVDVGYPAAEPTLGIAPDGTAFYAASTLVVDRPQVWGVAQTKVMRSMDGGLTWDLVQQRIPVTDVSIPPGNADPMVYVDAETGRVFDVALYGGCSWINFSDDKGQTWIPSPAGCGIFVNDHQTIVASEPRGLETLGYPNVLFYCVNQLIQSGCGRSVDGGLVWQPTESHPFPPGTSCGGLTGHLEADPEGRIFLPSGACGEPRVAISEDGGKTWVRRVIGGASAEVTHTSIASDDAGNLYYIWVQEHSGPTRRLAMLSISTDHGLTWGTPIDVTPPGVNFVNFPVVGAGDEGRIAISFPGTTAPTPGARLSAWNHYVAVSTSILTPDPIFVSATANDPADPIHRGECLGRCDGLWDFLDIQVSPAGEAWASTADDCTGECVSMARLVHDHVGRGIAIRQIGGPSLRDAG